MSTRTRLALGVAGALAATALVGCAQQGNQTNLTISPTPAGSDVPLPVAPSAGGSSGPDAVPSGAGGRGSGSPRVVETVVTGLDTPTGLDFFSNGDALVAERDTLRVLRVTGKRRVVQEVGTLAPAGGENAARGLAIDPDFPRTRAVYFYLASTRGDQVVRARLENGVLGVPQVVVDDIPHASSGGSIVFGPNDSLYVATGNPDARTQDPDSLAGSILRVTADGRPVDGNPEDTAVWATGLRDVRGLAFDEDQLWALDVGEQTDELNTIEGGQDYGWPDQEGLGTDDTGTTGPEVVWDDDGSVPGGLAYVDGRMWVTDLDGERLWAVEVDGEADSAEEPESYLDGELGRLRTIARAPDRSLWVTTSDVETGSAQAEGDRIVRIEP